MFYRFIFSTLCMALLFIGAISCGNKTTPSADLSGVTWRLVTSEAFSSREAGGCVVFNGNIYLLGGRYFSPTDTATNEVLYSSDGITWSSYLASWEARFNQAAIVHDGAIWIFGGKDSSGMVYKDLWKSPNGHTWELVTDELNNIGSREFSTLASFDNFLWLAGGFHEELGRYYSDLWKSSDGKEWTRILPGSATLSTVLSYSGGILWVQTYFSCPITLEALTSTNGINWAATSVASLAGNSVPLNATIHNNKFWALGVFDPNSGSSQPTTETYSSSDFKSWTCVTPEAPWLPRDNAYCVSFKNKIWLIGGSIQIDHDVFLPLSDVWVSPAE